MNGTNSTGDDGEHLFVVFLDYLYYIISVIGVLANMMTFITLVKNKDKFQDVVRIILQYQSILDGLVCLTGFLLLVFPPFWNVGNVPLDTFLCHLWHGTFLFWSIICMSIYNLLTLAIERYICICHPLKYKFFTKTKVRIIMVVFFFIGLFFTTGASLHVRMENGYCVSKYVNDSEDIKRFFAFFAISAFFTFYTIPTAFFAILYGFVAYTLRKRSKEPETLGASGPSRHIDTASSALTKTAVVVTIIYFLSFSWDINYYLLARLGATTYVLNTPLQKVGTFLALVNSFVNPFIYASFMPIYRHSVMKTWMPCITKR